MTDFVGSIATILTHEDSLSWERLQHKLHQSIEKEGLTVKASEIPHNLVPRLAHYLRPAQKHIQSELAREIEALHEWLPPAQAHLYIRNAEGGRNPSTPLSQIATLPSPQAQEALVAAVQTMIDAKLDMSVMKAKLADLQWAQRKRALADRRVGENGTGRRSWEVGAEGESESAERVRDGWSPEPSRGSRLSRYEDEHMDAWLEDLK